MNTVDIYLGLEEELRNLEAEERLLDIKWAEHPEPYQLWWDVQLLEQMRRDLMEKYEEYNMNKHMEDAVDQEFVASSLYIIHE